MTRLALLTVLALTLPTPALAQGLALSVRGGGGMPVGAFAQAAGDETEETETMLAGARGGLGFGLDASLSLGRSLGIYAGFDQVRFGCGDEQCGTDAEYKLAGFSAGIQMTPVRIAGFRPWVRGGVTFSELDGSRGEGRGLDLRSDRAPGFELGAGVHVPLFGILAITPQVRYVGQHAKVRVPGIDAPAAEQNVAYFSFDMGFGFAR